MSNWRHAALCRGFDPELWFPIAGPGTPTYREQVGEAKAVCQQCPVREQCLEWALGERFGVSGGLDEYERRALRQLREQEVSA